ncbi:ECF transporter S component [Streptococcus merionis]|uniref:Riboflavin transporter n=1 Tax=Streptococcus merionis TaxID=400065 RepID=A0A239SUK3_9STRE|nr:ECF transporter S component [Streptococcus merionis]SNU89161.1 Substrate-specific component RibU of riboflavin ECF transporter [Streptococcus merionis]
MTNTRKMALIAILSAVSFLLMLFQLPLIPGADFLQMDFSILPVLIGLAILDAKSSLTILLLRSLLKLLLNSNGVATYIGLPMNILAMGIFILSFAMIWKKRKTPKQFALAAGVATLMSSFGMLVANYLYAVPLYAAYANFDIKAILGLGNYLFAMVLPFNFLQGVSLSLAFYGLYTVMRPILKTYEK